jgi:predicted SAM-dependent methyltransferase
MSSKKLEIGSGINPIDGFIHLSLNPKLPHVEVIADARELPFNDNEFVEIVANHVLEHIFWHESEKALREWYRVLVPEGRIKIVVPNLKWVINFYLDKSDKWKEHTKNQPFSAKENKIDIINHYLYGTAVPKGNQHVRMFTAEYLRDLMCKVGFRQVEVVDDNIHIKVRAVK